jgi:hypothetical protein
MGESPWRRLSEDHSRGSLAQTGVSPIPDWTSLEYSKHSQLTVFFRPQFEFIDGRSLWLMKPVIVALLLLASIDQRTPDDWFRMVIELQQQAHKLDLSDKAFLKYMINVISLGSFVEPSLTERKTLFEIKRKLDDEQ